MAILIDREQRVLVQGITGREGRARTRLMRDFGTNVVAGCTPGKGGQDVEGVPVFDTVADAIGDVGGVDISVVFVPARLVKAAAIEAIAAGVKLLVLVPDRVPLWDAMAIAEAARDADARFVGPNTLGVISPGKAVLGMIGGRAESARTWFNPPQPGQTVGVISRSGGMTSSCGYYLSRRGIGLSTLVHVGGDSIVGLPIPEVALRFQADDETDAIVIFGEIGGSQEERLAELMTSGRVTKPVVAYIGGKAAREGTRFSHAGAIIEGGRGTHAGKVAALRAAGVVVVDGFGDLPDAAAEALGAPAFPDKVRVMTGANPNAWTTAITEIEPNHVRVRGYDLGELMGQVSFGGLVYLILRGELPTPPVAALVEAILCAGVDHGATPPSALAARTVASTGASLSASVAAGLLAINQHHGGAIESCARTLSEVASRTQAGDDLDAAAVAVVDAAKSAGRRIAGFGHRIHTADPRTTRLFELASVAQASAAHVAAARAIEAVFAKRGKTLPINVDGAIAAVLADLGFEPEVMNGFFMIPRTAGLVAHVREEQVRMKPMRRIDPVGHTYDGPKARGL